MNSHDIVLTLFGLLVGSFLNVVIYRLPRLMSITWVRSKCTSCGKKIFWYENIPVISYIFLRGKCSACGAKISLKYPIVEVVAAVAAYFLSPPYLTTDTLFYFALYFSIFCIFLSQFVIDLEHKLLMDSLNICLALLFLVFTYQESNWVYSIVGGAVGFGVPLGITWLFYKIRGVVGLGGGDIKLYGVLGIYLGAQGVIHNMVFSCGLGALIGGLLFITGVIKRNQPIPFGPFIILVAFMQVFFHSQFNSFVSLIFG